MTDLTQNNGKGALLDATEISCKMKVEKYPFYLARYRPFECSDGGGNPN